MAGIADGPCERCQAATSLRAKVALGDTTGIPTCGNSSGSSAVQSSLARRTPCFRSQPMPSLPSADHRRSEVASRPSTLLRCCCEGAECNTGNAALMRLRPRWGSCYPTGKRKPKTWRRLWPSACALSHGDWPKKTQRTARSLDQLRRSLAIHNSPRFRCAASPFVRNGAPMPWWDGLRRAFAPRRLPGAGRFARVLRPPAPSRVGEIDRQGGGRQGRKRRCALRAARTREPPPRAIRSDAPSLCGRTHRAAPVVSGQSAALSRHSLKRRV